MVVQLYYTTLTPTYIFIYIGYNAVYKPFIIYNFKYVTHFYMLYYVDIMYHICSILK